MNKVQELLNEIGKKAGDDTKRELTQEEKHILVDNGYCPVCGRIIDFIRQGNRDNCNCICGRYSKSTWIGN